MNKLPFYVDINGDAWAPKASVKKPKPPGLKRTNERDKAVVSMGFLVTGRRPEYLAEVEADYKGDLAAYEKDPKTHKHPGTPDMHLNRWKRKHKPAKIRTKPFELQEAAQACAELARKAGWVEVSVDEIMKG